MRRREKREKWRRSRNRGPQKNPESIRPSADRTGCEGTCRRQSGLMAGARWDHPRREKPGEGATEDRAAQAGLTTTMAILPPEAEALIEAEARMEAVAKEGAADPSTVAGPSGAAAADLGENGLSGTSAGTSTSEKMIFLSCNNNCAYIFFWKLCIHLTCPQTILSMLVLSFYRRYLPFFFCLLKK